MKQKTKDNLIYLGIGLAIVAGFTTYMFYTERRTGSIQEIPRPILWGILSTPAIIGLILEQFWEYRRTRSLWVILAAVALINLLAVWTAYSYRWDPPFILWSTMTGVWIIAVFIVVQKFVARNGSGQ